MTSIAIVANKSAVGISSDTRASNSISGGFINDHSKKLFKLDDWSVAAIFGNSSIDNIPIRNIIENDKSSFSNFEPNIKSSHHLMYGFIKILNSALGSKFANSLIKDELINKICDQGNKIIHSAMGGKINKSKVKFHLDENFKFNNSSNEYFLFSDKTLQTICENLVGFEKVSYSSEVFKSFTSYIYGFLFGDTFDTQPQSGLVVVIYSKYSYFPEVYLIEFLGKLDGILKLKVHEKFMPAKDYKDGYIEVFGSSKYYSSIINGIDTYISNKINNFIQTLSGKVKNLKANDDCANCIEVIEEIDQYIDINRSELDFLIKNRTVNSEFKTRLWSDDELTEYSREIVKLIHLHQTLNEDKNPTTGSKIDSCLVNGNGIVFRD